MDDLQADLKIAGFERIDFYNDVAGSEFTKDSKVICTVATKGIAIN